MKYWIFREDIKIAIDYSIYTIVFENNTCTPSSSSLKGQFPLKTCNEGRYWVDDTSKTLTDKDITKVCNSYRHVNLLAAVETDQPLTWDFLIQQHPELLL